MLTQEQLEALMAMSDIGGMEEEAATQMALADKLRGMGGTRNDRISNINRAIGGLTGAYATYKGMGGTREAGDARSRLLARLMANSNKPTYRQGIEDFDQDEWETARYG